MKPLNVTQKLIQSHLVSGEMIPGTEIGLKIDQTLTQDATGTMVMLELEAMGIERAQTEISAQYVDHNLIQTDHKNADDHLFLQSAARKFGIYFSPAGNGVSHPVHMQRFAKPGKTLLGSDSHTCANGCMGMLAIGAGGIDVAMAIAGKPFYVKWFTGNRHRNVDATCANGEHAHTTICARMAIRAKQGFSWLSKTLHMDGMANTVSCGTKIDPEFTGSTL